MKSKIQRFFTSLHIKFSWKTIFSIKLHQMKGGTVLCEICVDLSCDQDSLKKYKSGDRDTSAGTLLVLNNLDTTNSK